MGYDVTIITPVFNGENYIADCINSVALQRGVTIQHIIIDDGSTDGTYDIVNKFSGVLLRRQDNSGAPAARNLGLSMAEGKYIKFLDADDFLHQDCLRNQLDIAREFGEKSRFINYGYRDIFWEHRKLYKRKVLKVNLDSFESDASLPEWVAKRISSNIMTSLPLYPLEALRKVGGFDLRLKSSQEWNLNIRLAIFGYKFIFDEVHCYTQRVHDSVSRISNRKCDPKFELVNDKYTYDMLHDMLNYPCVRDAWANRLRNKAKKFIIAGFQADGQTVLDEANKLSPQSRTETSYSNSYRIFVRLFGEIRAAKMYGIFLRLVRSILY